MELLFPRDSQANMIALQTTIHYSEWERIIAMEKIEEKFVCLWGLYSPWYLIDLASDDNK